MALKSAVTRSFDMPRVKSVIRGFLLATAVAFLAACGGTVAADPAPATVGEGIKLAEKRGDIPTLNHDSTLLGPDVDGNGVRDDIDAYVDAMQITGPQKSALKQASMAIASTFAFSESNKSELPKMASEISKAIGCIFMRFDTNTDSQMSALMQKITVNTKERFLAYAAFNAAMSGSVTSITRSGGCIE